MFRVQFPLYFNTSQEGFVLLCVCHQPKSRGTVKLNSRNPKLAPRIDPQYLQSNYDIRCHINAIRLAVEVLSTNAFQAIGVKIYWPKLKQCSNFGPYDDDFLTNYPNDHYLECLIRTVAITSHHPGGTCAIGDSIHSPLDNRLRYLKKS